MNFTSSQRNILNAWLEQIAMKLNPVGWDILEIGIAGDEKPSGSYKFFGKGNEWSTYDINAKWKPDIVGDITKSNLPDNSYDLIIMTQAIEHIWDYRTALKNIQKATRQYALIDCPFMYPFHQDEIRREDPWEEWDDYWRFTPSAFRKLLLEAGFNQIETKSHMELTLCLAKK